jgi:predicted TIM-barrel fold metal-dependent hydrolase
MNLWDIPAIDHHAHNLLKPEAVRDSPFPRAFTEGTDPAVFHNHARHTLFYHRSIRDIAGLLRCAPSEEAVQARREELGIHKLTAGCFDAANLSGVFLDDGFLPEELLPWEWHEQFVSVRRVLRLEYLAETLIEATHDFDSFLGRFHSRIDPPPPEVVAFKSIAAYRTGLEIEIPSHKQARSAYLRLKNRAPQRPLRLEEKPLIDFLLTQTLDISARHGIPLQLHTGFGDPDLDLRLGNPLHLRPLLEQTRWRNAPLVLLHGSYPYTREAGYLASVYPQVHLDTGLAIPFLSVSGMQTMMRQLLELAPVTKLMYSSDAHMIPELFYLGAKWGREVLGSILEEAVRDSDLNAEEADFAARAILADNAKALYLGNHPR